jgi:hypothetical protein
MVFLMEVNCVLGEVGNEFLYTGVSYIVSFVVPLLRLLVGGLSARRPVFDSRSVHVRLIMAKVALVQGFF